MQARIRRYAGPDICMVCVPWGVGVDEMSWDDMTKNHMAWPSVEEVRDYRRQVTRTHHVASSN